MIAVVALSPALDVTHHVDGVDWAGVNRPARVRAMAGGKGLNVASTLHALGADVLLLGVAGGPTGAAVRAGLQAAGVPAVFTEIAADTRRTFVVVDTRGGDVASFYEPAAAVTAAEFDQFLATYRDALPGCAAVVLSGSLPPGLPAGTYAELITVAAEAGVPVLLDTSGEALLRGVAAGPAIVKPNLAELAAAAGRPLRWAAGSDQARPGRTARASRTGRPCWRRPGGCGSTGRSPSSSRSAPPGCSRSPPTASGMRRRTRSAATRPGPGTRRWLASRTP